MLPRRSLMNHDWKAVQSVRHLFVLPVRRTVSAQPRGATYANSPHPCRSQPIVVKQYGEAELPHPHLFPRASIGRVHSSTAHHISQSLVSTGNMSFRQKNTYLPYRRGIQVEKLRLGSLFVDPGNPLETNQYSHLME